MIKVNEATEDLIDDFQAREKQFRQFVEKQFMAGKLHMALRDQLQTNIIETCILLEQKKSLHTQYKDELTGRQMEISKDLNEKLRDHMKAAGFDIDQMKDADEKTKRDMKVEIDTFNENNGVELMLPQEIINFYELFDVVLVELAHERKQIIDEFDADVEVEKAASELKLMDAKQRREYLKQRNATERDLYLRVQQAFKAAA